MADDLVVKLRETRNQLENALGNSMGADFQIDADFVRETVSALEKAIARLSSGMVSVPREPTPEMVSAALCSKAADDEGEFPALIDLLDFSGDNKARTVIRHALKCAMLAAAPAEGKREDAPVAPAGAAPAAEVCEWTLKGHLWWTGCSPSRWWSASDHKTCPSCGKRVVVKGEG